uniref:RTN4 protein n=1 Tax=Mesocestoides corti TaxID=53468 RepID=A0A5K3FPJ7_MESCO
LDTPRLTTAPAVSGSRVDKPKPASHLTSSFTKPTAQPQRDNCLFVKSTAAEPSSLSSLDPVSREIWSYKDPKDYIMAKMFKGISATYSAVAAAKSTTQSVFDEFKVAAAASKPKTPVVCTPEERQELELFEKVEAEIDKFGESEEPDEAALVEALSPLVEDFGRTWIRGKAVSASLEIPRQPVESPLTAAENSGPDESLAKQVMSNAASTVTLENPVTQPKDHNGDAAAAAAIQAAQSIQSIAETYVLDANDTLAAEGIPPVVIYDSVEKLLIQSHVESRGETSVMETSNTCTIPFLGTTTSQSGTPNEEEALEIFETEINDDFQAEVDSLSSDKPRHS